MTKSKIIILAITIQFAFLSCKTDKQENLRPNIIVIMSDDMGYSDIGCYGGVINTPVLDGLAKNGLRFKQFYNTARCCPSRASLLTGLYAHQAGIGHMMNDSGTDGYRGDLSNKAVTIAEVLKQAGYSTYISGKWHITPLMPSKENPSKHNWPLQRGFDKFFGTIHGAGSFYDPNSLTRDNEFIVPSEGFYYTDAISDNAVKFIEEHKSGNPFFLYIPYTAAHWPMHAKPEDIAKYTGKFDEGWDVLREKKYKKLLEMGLTRSEWKLTEKDDIPDWEDVELKDWYSSLMEVYAAMVDCMDQGIGRVMNILDKKGIKDNTLVFFLQDNGGCAEEWGFSNDIKPYYKDVEFDRIIPMGKDEFQTRMEPKYTRDGRPVLKGKGLKPGGEDTYLGYGKAWANASNTPFRMYKKWVHEGGISTPLIVHWPAGIKAKNEFREQPGHLIDIMATCIDVAGATYPQTFNNNKVIPFEGQSLTPVFENKDLQNRAIFWEHEGNKAVRLGKYKLVSIYKKDSEYNWELYDLESDRSETINLIGGMPFKAKEMETLWKDWAKKVGVKSWPISKINNQ
ncbi:arylsulfatase [Confluentibacter lentus]|uniref:arylsulfatase n=1 Tax=Confluentibacter lentus TaxID=1699412 RepID=UPI000C290165|nr:arylsulfatase [Confluentibacter lentus]